MVDTESVDDQPGMDLGAGSKYWFGLPAEANLFSDTGYVTDAQDVYSSVFIVEVDDELYSNGNIALEVFDQKLQSKNPPEPRFDTSYVSLP